MRVIPLAILLNLLVPILPSHAQVQFADSLFKTQEKRKKELQQRIRWMTAANFAGYGAAMTGLYSAWYRHYPQSSFHTFNDWGEWKQMDKVGHLYSAYIESMGSMELWNWAGLDRKKRIWIGGLSGAAYQTVIEILDGFSAQWGWSWGDFSANIAGSSLLIAQELGWKEQRVELKLSYHNVRYSDPILNNRSTQLFGSSTSSRFLKDYNGQTYWASVSLAPFLKKGSWPSWLNVAVGYGAAGMMGGFENISKDGNGNVVFDGRDVPRYRQWYIAPDLNWKKIKTNKKGVRLLFTLLNAFKLPAPTLEFSRGRFKFHPLYF
jgi:hypothetical protein